LSRLPESVFRGSQQVASHRDPTPPLSSLSACKQRSLHPVRPPQRRSPRSTPSQHRPTSRDKLCRNRSSIRNRESQSPGLRISPLHLPVGPRPARRWETFLLSS